MFEQLFSNYINLRQNNYLRSINLKQVFISKDSLGMNVPENLKPNQILGLVTE